MHTLSLRSSEKENMDSPDFSEKDIHDSFRFIRLVNQYLNGAGSTIHYLKKYSTHWVRSETISILDIGTGCADIPIEITKWAAADGYKVRIFALDYNQKTLDYAREYTKKYSNIELVRGDAFNLSYKPNSFDYVHSAMFFHHLTDSQIVNLLKQLNQIARRGIIINDLARNQRSYNWIRFFTMFLKNEGVRNDARVSVLRGFQEDELKDYIRQAGVEYLNVSKHFAHRLLMAGEKIS